jgi:Family of unknown function (DUF6308)
LARAYQCLATTRDVGFARAHKVLHHKQPLLVPVLDSVTAAIYQGERGKRLRTDWNLWQHIRDEIDANRAKYEELREWFAGQAATRGGVALGLLRLHDVLLWLHGSWQWSDALADGSKL